MSEPDDLELDSAVIDREAIGPSSPHGPPDAGALLPARRVAKSLGTSRRTLRNWEQRGWLLPVDTVEKVPIAARLIS